MHLSIVRKHAATPVVDMIGRMGLVMPRRFEVRGEASGVRGFG